MLIVLSHLSHGNWTRRPSQKALVLAFWHLVGAGPGSGSDDGISVEDVGSGLGILGPGTGETGKTVTSTYDVRSRRGLKGLRIGVTGTKAFFLDVKKNRLMFLRL